MNSQSLFVLIVLCGLLVFLCGCVNKGIVTSYDNFIETVGVDFVEYVKLDDSLNDEDKALRVRSVELARESVNKFKQTKLSW